MARPDKWEDRYAHMAAKASRLGATDREIAELLQVSERTLHGWKVDHPELVEALKVGKEIPDDRVELSLYRRAIGYSYDAVKIVVNSKGEVTKVPYTEHFPPDTTAAIFWLKNRRKDTWRDSHQMDFSGKVEVENRTIDPRLLSDEQRVGLLETLMDIQADEGRLLDVTPKKARL